MTKKGKGKDYLCQCGFGECTKEKLIEHSLKEHRDNPMMLFDQIGEAGSLEHANMLIGMFKLDNHNLMTNLSNANKALRQKNKECRDLIVANEKLQAGLQIIANAVNLTHSSINKDEVNND